MIDDLREEEIVNKVGGRFKLSTLIQKRLVALNAGGRPLVDVEPTRLGRVAAGSHRRLLEEAIDDKLHHHGPVQPLLPDFAPVPGGHRRIGQGGGLPAVLEQRGEDKERQHGEDGEGHHRGLLIGAEDAEASHGTA